MVGALILKGGGNRLTHRYTLRDVLAIAPTTIPVPIPLLYEEIGLDYLDVFDFELHSHFSNVLGEELGLGLLIDIITTLIPFFTENQYLLHEPGHTPDALKMEFTIGENTIRFPSYLGGGDKQGITELPPYNMTLALAYLLDGLKTLNVAYIIKSIPLYVPQGDSRNWLRVQNLKSSLSLGPIELGAEASWCIATEDELVGPIKSWAVEDGVIDKAGLANLGLALPEGSQFSERGFMIFIMGGIAFKPLLGLQAQFAIAYTQEQGFQTGIRLTAMLATFELTIGGTIKVSQDGTHIKGLLTLELPTAKERINLLSSSGEIIVQDSPVKLFQITLGGAIGNVELSGTLTIQHESVAMTGSLNWPIGQFSTGHAQIVFEEKEIVASCSGSLKLLSGELSFRLVAKQVSIGIELSQGLQQSIHDAIVNIANEQVNGALDKASEELNKALQQIKSYEGTVLQIRQKAVPGICNTALSEITKRINSEASKRCKSRFKWYEKSCRYSVKAAANRVAKPYRDKLSALKTAAAKGSQKAVVDAANELIKLAGKKLYGYTVLNEPNKTKLSNLVKFYAALDENIKIKGNNQKILGKFSEFDKMLSNIRRQVTGAMDQVVPSIEGVSFDLILDKAIPEEVSGTIRFKSGKQFSVLIYPNNPVKTSASIAKSVRQSFG